MLLCFGAGMQLKSEERQVFAKPTVFVMGDSKSHHYSKEKSPKEGWVQEFVKMLDTKTKLTIQHPKEYTKYSDVIRYKFDEYQIENWAVSGFSCKMFDETGRFDGMLKQVKKNDHVIIALQHNDAKKSVGESVDEYKKYLTSFAKKIRKKKATVVFMTTTPKNYLKSKKIKIYVPEYREAMLQVAKKQKCECIDLAKISTEYLNFRSKSYANSLYLKLARGKYPAWKDGINDNTHYTAKGAKVFAQMIAVDLQSTQKIKIFKFKKNTNSLFRLYQKSCTYKNKNKYTSTTWKDLIKQRNLAWKVLYTPEATENQYKTAEKGLKAALKKIKTR